MTVLDMVIQLIFPIAAILTTRNHAPENLGGSLVLLGMTFEVTLTFERTVAFGASVTGWNDLSGVVCIVIVVYVMVRFLLFGSGCRLGPKDVCSKLASVVIDGVEGVWECTSRAHLGAEAICSILASVDVTVVDGVGSVRECTGPIRMGGEGISMQLASIAVTVVDGIGRVRECTSRIRMGVEAISLKQASVAVTVVDGVGRV